MKRKLSLLLALALMFSLTACGGREDVSTNNGTANTPPVSSTTDPSSPGTSEISSTADPTTDTSSLVGGDGGGILIAYFGVIEDGTDTVANASRVATADGVVGNCQFIAQAIQQAVGGDLFAIETVQDYPRTH
ncbi:MAG: hypothetical protein HFF50_09315 [Lawsonibacter sp.]|nr:hypothetical protein [Lawsonibacter sp.]